MGSWVGLGQEQRNLLNSHQKTLKVQKPLGSFPFHQSTILNLQSKIFRNACRVAARAKRSPTLPALRPKGVSNGQVVRPAKTGCIIPMLLRETLLDGLLLKLTYREAFQNTGWAEGHPFNNSRIHSYRKRVARQRFSRQRLTR